MPEIAGRRLLIDTCGETAGVALSDGDRIVAKLNLETGRASAEIVHAIRGLLLQVDWRLSGLAAIGVVSGPGSFTGVRTGLAAAKGLSEAAGLPMVTVSRLAVLADATAAEAVVALDAGRGDVYVRDGGREFLCRLDDLESLLGGRSLTVAEERLYSRLIVRFGEERTRWCGLHVADALPLVLLADSSQHASFTEANYVREERDIYPRVAGK